MNFKRIRIVLAFLMLVSLSVFARGNFYYHSISIDEIEQSLPAKPIAVGFDVDDTVLFSSPGFYYGFENTDGINGTNKYGKRPLSNDKFWEDMNSQFDKFSIPKESARKVIEMHKNRGDRIYFVTARPETRKEILSKLLKKIFNLPEGSPDTIFSGRTSKGVFIKKHNISLFYGDSDSDISEANEVGIRAIRFLRSVLSTNKSKYHPGMHGEAVLENSEN
ncbi:MAG: acid phosphatase [Clostridiales bacterium]|jgi:acid phosphatase (class B)|nr:acid phosphatase [Clostridiales bacterium]MDN5281059.1 acid phosphatase [Candidatus Ozemobacter sp.]